MFHRLSDGHVEKSESQEISQYVAMHFGIQEKSKILETFSTLCPKLVPAKNLDSSFSET